MKKVHAEIEYKNEDGEFVHSDICPPKCSSDNLSVPSYRDLLHAFLDEWLEHSNGTGGFYIKDETHRFEFQNDDIE